MIESPTNQMRHTHFEGVHPALLQQVQADPADKRYFDKCVESLDKELEDAELRDMYEGIIERDDLEILKLKSEKKLAQLEGLYYGDLSLGKLKDFTSKEEHLMGFVRMVENSNVVIGTSNTGLDKFESARKRGEAFSFGPQDALVHADKYVFASFDKIPHFMTGHSEDSQVVVAMDADTKNRSQIVFQDFANIMARDQDHPVRTYIDNMFDYENGKRILSIYLASIFEDPEEAELFLERNNHPRTAQQWDSDPESSPISFSINQERDRQIVERMRELKHLTNIEPPFSIEVKIRDEATVRKASD